MPVENYLVGASLFMWRDYFPNAEIYSCDIREDILINEDRIRSYKVDQSQSSELFNLIEVIGKDFDLIVDDGSHITDHQIISAIALLPYLHKDGVYIIEDVSEPKRVVDNLTPFGYNIEVKTFNQNAPDDRLIIITKNDK